MAGIDDAVLRRRQLDLDKRTADLQKYFERLAGQKMATMGDIWRQLDRRLQAQLKALYKEMGALQDPNKIKALKGKADRLEAFIAQIQRDIISTGAQQQPYYTGILKHQFEKAYYMNAWGLEQAAKVTATVPVLTPAQVLGVLANPWLPDKANYSDRIRANTALLAQEMKETIQQAVEEGLDWNTVARNIQTRTGEGYFRAVRLARTELNRAAALGASYSYLQNQDVLDGKRWNATLDNYTAAKDAANDTKVFDLDYDTPENPGVPGKRIPNHPNCRCIWSPILSALGINDKDRIARDGNSRTYTKAGSYREYAKEYGLPNLDDRLSNDYLKSYLRPGESVVDLNKEVRRWTYRGKTIQVPTPDWVKPPEVIPPIATAVKKPRAQRKPKTPAPAPTPQRPMLVQKLVDVVNKHMDKGAITDRRKMARDLLDNVDLKRVPEYIEKQSSRGYCAYTSTTRASGKIGIAKYSLQSTDTRDDLYKVKTTFHELFHATADGLEHDYMTGVHGWDFDAWVDIEETYAESASHYLTREAGIMKKLQPAYPDKLVRNLPRLKKLDMFKDCQTIEDFGEVMVKYRMIDRKTSLWHNIKIDMDSANKFWDIEDYARKNYVDYIQNNLEDLVDKVLENSPESRSARSFILNDARTVWDVIKNGGPAPTMGNEAWVFNNVLAAAMREVGVL